MIKHFIFDYHPFSLYKESLLQCDSTASDFKKFEDPWNFSTSRKIGMTGILKSPRDDVFCHSSLGALAFVRQVTVLKIK